VFNRRFIQEKREIRNAKRQKKQNELLIRTESSDGDEQFVSYVQNRTHRE